MTVRELISSLQNCPEDYLVYLVDGDKPINMLSTCHRDNSEDNRSRRVYLGCYVPPKHGAYFSRKEIKHD